MASPPLAVGRTIRRAHFKRHRVLMIALRYAPWSYYEEEPPRSLD